MRGKLLLVAAAAVAAVGVGVTAALLGPQTNNKPAAQRAPDTATLRSFVQTANAWLDGRQDTAGVSFSMSDAQNGWRTDGKSVFRTKDGGRTWSAAAPFYDGGALDFADGTHVYALAKTVKEEMRLTGMTLYATADAGASWRHTAFSGAPLFGADTLVRGVDGFAMADAQNGMLLLAGDAAAGNHDALTFTTADGGRTFTAHTGTLRLPTGQNALRQTDALHAYLFVNGASAPAQLYATADGGDTWQQPQGLPEARYVDVTPMLYPVWMDGTARLALFESQNGLENYPAASGSQKRTGPDDSMRADFYLLDENGGVQSELTSLRTALPIDGKSVSMPDARHLFAFTQEKGKGVLFAFTAGAGWSRVSASGLPDDAVQLQFVNETDGFLLASDAFYTTADGGRSWTRHTL